MFYFRIRDDVFIFFLISFLLSLHFILFSKKNSHTLLTCFSYLWMKRVSLALGFLNLRRIIDSMKKKNKKRRPKISEWV